MDRTILTCKEFVRNTAEMGPSFVEPVTDTIEMIFDEMVRYHTGTPVSPVGSSRLFSPILDTPCTHVSAFSGLASQLMSRNWVELCKPFLLSDYYISRISPHRAPFAASRHVFHALPPRSGLAPSLSE